jgi:dinuclear metal center YbgI/SA1388 family protein
MAERTALLALCDGLLQPERFKDYCPNGLQVEGRPQVQSIASGVTASLALIQAAIEAGADTLLVHHGLFWRNQTGTVTGWLKSRLALLLQHDINLLAYHLPLDAHPALGNNAQLATHLGFRVDGTFGEQGLGFVGQPQVSCESGQALAQHLQSRLGKLPVSVVPDAKRPVRRIAWCTGGAQNLFEEAIAQGVDAFITGEISEPQAHLAHETGVSFFACGHHATERYGAPALGAHLAEQLGVKHVFIDIDNPA